MTTFVSSARRRNLLPQVTHTILKRVLRRANPSSRAAIRRRRGVHVVPATWLVGSPSFLAGKNDELL
jgi:hypothetical protein